MDCSSFSSSSVNVRLREGAILCRDMSAGFIDLSPAPIRNHYIEAIHSSKERRDRGPLIPDTELIRVRVLILASLVRCGTSFATKTEALCLVHDEITG